MELKYILKTNRLTKNFYDYLKYRRDIYQEKRKFNWGGWKFEERAHGCETLCIILAGYKEFLYPKTLDRIARFAPANMDICVASSGINSEYLKDICRKNGWSYLSTKKNNVCLIQNMAIKLHPNANYIFKLDEDIFITEGYFEHMKRAYQHAQNGQFNPGVMAPIIPINGYGHMRVLEKLNLLQTFKEKFEEPKYMAGNIRQIENNPDAAKFFWDCQYIPSIDELNKRFSLEKPEERACPIRFSIGAIFFERGLWEDMKYFSVNRGTTGMGRDEIDLCSYCLIKSRPLMVSENIVVGHLSFGRQNGIMKQYFLEHMEQF